LVSFPVLPEDASVASVLEPVAGLFLEANTLDVVPLVNRVGLPEDLNTLRRFKFGGAYWIKMRSSADLEVVGARYDGAIEIQLKQGWNYFGVVGDEPVDIRSALFGIEGSYAEVRGFDQGGLTYIAGLPEVFQTLLTVRPGFGYMINMHQPATLTLSGDVGS
jgi:hypothetical protein